MAVRKVYTKPLLDKLGVKPGARVGVLGVTDPIFRKALAGRTDDVHESRAAKHSELIFLLAESPASLRRLVSLAQKIVQNGAIWVVAPKATPPQRDRPRAGRSKSSARRPGDRVGARGKGGLPYEAILAGAKAAGLVDVKVVRFSDTHTALKLVIPLKLRK